MTQSKEGTKSEDRPAESKGGSGGLIAGILICIVLALGGVGFGIYGMFFNGANVGQSSSGDNTSDNSSNEYVVRDLRNKTFRLLGSRNGLSSQDYYDSKTNKFVIYADYMPTKEILSNELSDSLKTYIALETTILDKEKYCSYKWDGDVSADIDKALSGTHWSNTEFGQTVFDCISYDAANDDYYDLWGENIQKLNAFSAGIKTYGDYTYGPNVDAFYYHVVGGRGGTSSNYTIGKIMQIEEKDDSAAVEIKAGSYSISAGEPEKIYSDIERNKLHKTIEHESTTLAVSELSDSDYDSFQGYRFVFKKNTKGIYSFSGVEKL